jgi:hypothetical protein
MELLVVVRANRIVAVMPKYHSVEASRWPILEMLAHIQAIPAVGRVLGCGIEASQQGLLLHYSRPATESVDYEWTPHECQEQQ